MSQVLGNRLFPRKVNPIKAHFYCYGSYSSCVDWLPCARVHIRFVNRCMASELKLIPLGPAQDDQVTVVFLFSLEGIAACEAVTCTLNIRL